MPGTRVAGNKLRDVPAAVDHKMCRDSESLEIFLKPGVGLEIKLVEKQICDEGCAKLPGWQTDVVNDE